MQSSQADIIDLLKQFAPEYNATGQSLGEQLVDGFMGKVGDIETWFAKLTSGLTSGINSQLQMLANVGSAAADQYYAKYGIPSAAGSAAAATPSVTKVGPTFNVYFTEPKEYTPSEIRAELERLVDRLTDFVQP